MFVSLSLSLLVSLLSRIQYSTPLRRWSHTSQEGRREMKDLSRDLLSMSSGRWLLLKYLQYSGPHVYVHCTHNVHVHLNMYMYNVHYMYESAYTVHLHVHVLIFFFKLLLHDYRMQPKITTCC